MLNLTGVEADVLISIIVFICIAIALGTAMKD